MHSTLPILLQISPTASRVHDQPRESEGDIGRKNLPELRVTRQESSLQEVQRSPRSSDSLVEGKPGTFFERSCPTAEWVLWRAVS